MSKAAVIATRRIEFDAAHRILAHESKCKYLHGHRYVLEVSFSCEELDALGRVIDFGVIKEILGQWIDTHLDHNVILAEADKQLGDYIAAITQQKIYYLPFNPTAENIAKHIFEAIIPALFKDYSIVFYSLKLYETPNCHVTILA